ncbi:M16 family metallopeptidase [Hufsiella ginkgonis]|uniref:Insulinase family protein n=1 Tax=Hufsiella ginkgonis TaxID=2695274 RepID=A0A7K1XZ28_9SPHI|nr:pitrilysin family protein [Hufsiella ginkgonis]MXV16220.1 insulinase family protein [Hufsiella ginkgonis]
MKKHIILTALFLASIAASAQVGIDRSKKPSAGPAPVITIKDPVIFTLPNGVTVLVVEDHKLPKVDASLFIDMGPVTEGSKAGLVSLMGSMLNEGTKDMTKAQFDEAVDRIGANVYLGFSGSGASALTRYFPQAFELMAKGVKTPAFPQESFDKIKSQTLTGMKADEKNVKAVSTRLVNALSYGKTHPNGEFATEKSISALTLADVKASYAKYITPSRAYLTFVGDITPDQAKKLSQSFFADWKGAPLKLEVLAPVANPLKTEINVVDMPNAVQSEITVVNLVDLKMNNPDYFPLLLANQILGGGASARLFMNLREKHGFTYGAYSSVGAGRFQSRFSASAAVRTAKTDSAVNEFLNEIARLRDTEVADDELTDAKALYNGSFALGMENTERTATYARNILLNGLPKDFYRTYLQKLNAVTKADIKRVAQKYFNYANTRVVVVGNSDQILESLKKLKYPVKQYDTYANAVVKSTAPVTVKAADVLNAYLTAIGGTAELAKVKTLSMLAGMEMQGMAIDVTSKGMTPNKELMTMSMGGNVMMKTVFDGTSGYQLQMGQKKQMTVEEIKEKNAITGLFEQVDYVKNPAFKAEVKGIEKVAGADAYKLVITYPSGKVKTEYYNTTTKLLVKRDEVDAATGVNTTSEFSNYKKIGTILYPYDVTLTVSAGGQSQVLPIKAKEVKLNEGVTAEDFK